MFELGGRGPAKETLARARQARQKMERLLAALKLSPPATERGNSPRRMQNARLQRMQWTQAMHVYIEDIGKHEGEEVTIKGWLHNRRSSGKIHFLIAPRRHRFHPGA